MAGHFRESTTIKLIFVLFILLGNAPLSSQAASITTEEPPICLQKGGRVEHYSLHSEKLPQPLDFRVYIPACYNVDLQHRYPVLYLIHGQGYDDSQWLRLGVKTIADELIASLDIPPTLIVMPYDRSWKQPTEDPFGQVLVDELIPFIDQRYRTRTDRTYRAIGGLSRGAGWAVNLGLSQWQWFGAIGGHSLPIFWSDATKIQKWIKAIPEGEIPRIYMDIGDHDRPSIISSANWFKELLNESGIPYVWYQFKGFHDEAYWQRNLPHYLRWYTAEW